MAVGAVIATGLPAIGQQTAAPACSIDWPMFQRHNDRTGASCVSGINRGNIATLTPKWFVPTTGAVTAEPAVVGDTVYIGDGVGVMRALNAATGAVRWTFDVRNNTGYNDEHAASYGVIVSSAAVATVPGKGPTVFFGGGGTLYALNATNGRVRWATDIDPRFKTSPAEIESSPVVYTDAGGNQLVTFGFDTNEATGSASGGIVALDTSTGLLRWKYDTEINKVVYSLTFRDQQGTGCGDVWASPSFDAGTRQIFFGIGNCDLAEGDTQYLRAISADTGAPIWKFVEPAANHGIDHDFGATPVLITDSIGRRLVVQAGKSGWVYVINAKTGQLVRSVKAAVGSSIGGFIGSTGVGMVKGHAALFGNSAIPSPDGGLPGPPNENTSLHAVDLITGKVLWHAAQQPPAYAPTTVANGVVFAPSTTDFSINAYDAVRGIQLWRFPTGAAMSGGVAVNDTSVYVGAGTYFSPDAQVPKQVTGVWSFALPI
jgi:polyvinyl alcohol dehydrogenase (cytochrome)